ncbi:hypothetical protein HUJ04_010795 [Dendroctonus ponderosae]|nr:hypothetical protein HUJ04_010795 [Dendroctonus ponderosae]
MLSFVIVCLKGQIISDWAFVSAKVKMRHNSFICYVHHFQIGSLKGFYLLEHQNIRKRSSVANSVVHKTLSEEPQGWNTYIHSR